MGEKQTKICLLTLNVVVLIAGILMVVGGILLEYTQVGESVLMMLNSVISSSQLGAIGIALIALGAMILLISFMGCCGAVSESRCLLTLYFTFVLLLFLSLFGVVIASFVYGGQAFYDVIYDNLRRFVSAYDAIAEEVVLVDTVQQFFQCCGYNGTSDFVHYGSSSPTTISTNTNTTNAMINYETSMMTATTTTNIELTQANVTATNITLGPTSTPRTAAPTYLNGSWPESCCKIVGSSYVNVTLCQDNSLPRSVLENYLNTEGCTSAIEAWVQQNLIIIGGVTAGIAVIMIVSMIAACSLRSSLD